MTILPLRTVVDSISFEDADSRTEATAIVRLAGKSIGLSTFVVDGGECEIYMPPSSCEQLIAALQRAVRLSKGAPTQG
jgi:hypothetical protein